MSSPLKASVVMNPSAVYLHSEIQNSNMIQTDEDLTCNRLDLTMHERTRLTNSRLQH